MFLEVGLSQLALFVFGVIGLTNILIYGKILQGLRDFFSMLLPDSFYEILECYQCMGFWTGMIIGYIVMTSHFSGILVCGFAGSFLSHFAALLVEYLEAHNMIPYDVGYIDEENIDA